MEREKWKVEEGEWKVDRARSSIFHPLPSIFHLVHRWAVVVLWMAGIFYFSSRSTPLGFLPSAEQRGSVRKVAHFAEFAGLLLLLHRALGEHGSEGAREQRRLIEGKSAHNPKPSSAPQPLCASVQKAAVGRQRSAVAFAIALAYALFDELHQELVPGRGFELADIRYDLMGIIAALGLIWFRERNS